MPTSAPLVRRKPSKTRNRFKSKPKTTTVDFVPHIILPDWPRTRRYSRYVE